MDESILRMKMVMALLLGAHNECREVLIEVAKDVTIKVDKGSVYVAAEDAQQQAQK